MSSNPKPFSSFVLYTAPSGDVKLDVFLQDETLWLTQRMMAELFGVDVRTISEHLRNIYQSKELDEDPTVRKIRIVQGEGGRKISRKIPTGFDLVGHRLPVPGCLLYLLRVE